MGRVVFCLLMLCMSLPAFAAGFAVVDFQRALSTVEEGKRVEAELNQIMQNKQSEMKALETQLQTAMQAYQQQQQLLSDQARAEKEQELYQLQMQAQQAAYAAEMEFQQIYTQKMEVLIGKMRVVANEIGVEKQYDMVFEATESGVVYHSSNVPDVTTELITRYNKKHP